MPYTRPPYNDADATFLGAAAYTMPDDQAAGYSWYTGDQFATLADNGVLGAPMLLVAQQPVAARLSVASPLGNPSFLVTPLIAFVSVASPLGDPALLSNHDYTDVIAGYGSRYVMDLVTPGGDVRVPISSWRATPRTDAETYAGCVIPNCLPYLEDITAATEFVISRQAITPDGVVVVTQEMVRAPLDTVQTDNGTTNYTCSISGYGAAITADEDPDPAFDRLLPNIRSVSVYETAVRVRCAIDWTLRPGARALYGEASFIVSYINYYVIESDQYMDVGGPP